jgi:malate dehydrogenase (oxaloacetate-decarboxylating)
LRSGADLGQIVRALSSTALVGVCGEAGAFTRAPVEAMAATTRRPLILPLSNPTSQSEATPADLLAWTGGRALIATGSPFDPVVSEGRAFRVGQSNNAFIFPGVGLGALVSGASEVTDGMFTAAAECLAGLVSDDDLAAGSLFPPIRDLRRVAGRIAEAVVRAASDEGVSRSFPYEKISAEVADARWEPRYQEPEMT